MVRQAHTYTIADLGIRYDADENGVIDGNETMAAIADYIAGRIVKEEALGIVRLNFLRCNSEGVRQIIPSYLTKRVPATN